MFSKKHANVPVEPVGVTLEEFKAGSPIASHLMIQEKGLFSSKSWKKRWFRLTICHEAFGKGCIYVFSDQKEKKVLAVHDISSCNTSDLLITNPSTYQFRILIPGHKQEMMGGKVNYEISQRVEMTAPDKDSMEIWLACIWEAIVCMNSNADTSVPIPTLANYKDREGAAKIPPPKPINPVTVSAGVNESEIKVPPPVPAPLAPKGESTDIPATATEAKAEDIKGEAALDSQKVEGEAPVAIVAESAAVASAGLMAEETVQDTTLTRQKSVPPPRPTSMAFGQSLSQTSTLEVKEALTSTKSMSGIPSKPANETTGVTDTPPPRPPVFTRSSEPIKGATPPPRPQTPAVTVVDDNASPLPNVVAEPAVAESSKTNGDDAKVEDPIANAAEAVTIVTPPPTVSVVVSEDVVEGKPSIVSDDVAIATKPQPDQAEKSNEPVIPAVVPMVTPSTSETTLRPSRSGRRPPPPRPTSIAPDVLWTGVPVIPTVKAAQSPASSLPDQPKEPMSEGVTDPAVSPVSPPPPNDQPITSNDVAMVTGSVVADTAPSTGATTDQSEPVDKETIQSPTPVESSQPPIIAVTQEDAIKTPEPLANTEPSEPIVSAVENTTPSVVQSDPVPEVTPLPSPSTNQKPDSTPPCSPSDSDKPVDTPTLKAKVSGRRPPPPPGKAKKVAVDSPTAAASSTSGESTVSSPPPLNPEQDNSVVTSQPANEKSGNEAVKDAPMESEATTTVTNNNTDSTSTQSGTSSHDTSSVTMSHSEGEEAVPSGSSPKVAMDTCQTPVKPVEQSSPTPLPPSPSTPLNPDGPAAIGELSPNTDSVE
eukprot:Ihof_evm14s72 gene=Ihof_evmTU14s72